MKVSNSLVLSAAVAGLVAGGASLATAPSAFAKAAKAACYNSCQGKHGCNQKNMPTSDSCSGHLKYSKDMTAEQCKKAHGTPTAAAAAPAAAAPAPGAAAPSEAPKQ